MKKLLLLIIAFVTSYQCLGAEVFGALSTMDKIKAGSILYLAVASSAYTAIFGSAAIVRVLDSYFNETIDKETGEVIQTLNYPDDVKHYCYLTASCAVWSAIFWYQLKKHYNISPIA
jgi:hypothetical protein